MARSNTSDHYSVLQVNPRAQLEVVEAAYHALMKLNHPDHGGDTDKAATINGAYKVLSTVKTRKAYDKERNKLDGKVIGNFKVLDVIAEGGIGKTYKGEHIITKAPVCIKHCSEISSGHDAIMINEAKAMWDLRHFAIPAVRDLIRMDDDSLVLVMSYIPGYTLEQVVEKKGKIDPEHVSWMCERILNALKYLHFNGVVHGDLKPQNIIIRPEDHSVVLLDFGLAIIKPKDTSKAVGYTDHFSPPEQLLGAPLIPETDFYSLGMTLIYALGGDMKYVERKEVSNKVPDAMCDYIRRMIVRSTLERPNWSREDLCETVRDMRIKSFGRAACASKKLEI